MKKLGKLKLHELNKREIENKQMVVLKGGYSCNCSYTCGCTDYPPGGIGNSANNANFFGEWSMNNLYSAMGGS